MILSLTRGVGRAKQTKEQPRNECTVPLVPSIFVDDNGALYLVWGNAWIAPVSSDLSDFVGNPVQIESGSYAGKYIGRLQKIRGKYCCFSVGTERCMLSEYPHHMYYRTSDHPMGPYGARQRIEGVRAHRIPFRCRKGNWWCAGIIDDSKYPSRRRDRSSCDSFYAAINCDEGFGTFLPLKVSVADGNDLIIKVKAFDAIQ